MASMAGFATRSPGRQSPPADDLLCYRQAELSTAAELQAFADQHRTETGTWARLRLSRGRVGLRFVDRSGSTLSAQELDERDDPELTVPPAVLLELEGRSNPFRLEVSFCCQSHRYFEKKHGLSQVHVDLLAAYQQHLQGQGLGRVLDAGCGSGRNLLFLAKMGHAVTGLENGREKLARIKAIARQEGLKDVTLVDHDLHQRLPFAPSRFDMVIATVVLQFLRSERVDSLLGELSEATAAGGFHFLVFPVFSETFTLPQNFTFLPERDALFHWYQDRVWSLIDYQVSHGQLTRKDADGRPIQGLFAVLLAQKPNLRSGASTR